MLISLGGEKKVKQFAKSVLSIMAKSFGNEIIVNSHSNFHR